jgi:hypothetical protein
VLRRSPELQWRYSWREAGELAALRWDWRDPPTPLEAVQGAASNLHYYEAEELLTGPVIMKVGDERAWRVS